MNPQLVHLIFLLLAVSTVFPVSVPVDQFSTNLPIAGACQSRCLKKYGRIVEKENNRGVIVHEVDIHNNTDFSLCKLGCTSPSFNDLHLPPFRFGQSAHHSIITNTQDFTNRPTTVRDINFLCIQSLELNKTSIPMMTLSAKVELLLFDGVDPTGNVYFVEVVAHEQQHNSEEHPATVVLFHDWCYTTTCNVSVSLAELGRQILPKTSIQLRLTSFDELGASGGVVTSRWFSLEDLQSRPRLDMMIIDKKWFDDKAAVELALDSTNKNNVPMCNYELGYRNTLSAQYLTVPWAVDNTRGITIKNLEFTQSYTVKLGPKNSTIGAHEPLASLNVDIPACMELVNDPSMCAPPPVARFGYEWNVTANQSPMLTLNWDYFNTDRNKNGETSPYPLVMSHFVITILPLVTQGNYQCQLLEPLRRDVTWTHRRVVFYVPDSKCNYEAEITAIDIKKRTSTSKKIQIVRVDEPTIMFLRADAWGSPLMLVIFFLLISALVITMSVAVCRMRDRREINAIKKNFGTEPDTNRVVFAFASADGKTNAKTVVGMRPLSCNQSDISDSSQQHWFATRRCSNGFYERYPKTSTPTPAPLHKPPMRFFDDSRLSDTIERKHDDDNGYETIGDFGPSESSNEYIDYTVSNGQTSLLTGNFLTLPQIAISAEVPDLPTVLVDSLHITQQIDNGDENPWKMVNVLDANDHFAYGMKIVANGGSFTKVRRELQIVSAINRNFDYHENIVRLLAVAVYASPSQVHRPSDVCGILFEQCRGGTLRQFIRHASSQLRRLTVAPPGPLLHATVPRGGISPQSSSTPPSSGYDGSLRGSGATTPEQHVERLAVCLSSRFCKFSEEISSALDFIHRRDVLHTHITAANIYLVRDWYDALETICDQSVKLGDFGWAEVGAVTDISNIDDSLCPPELRLNKPYEAKGDIWQFGHCLVEMATLGGSERQEPTGIDVFEKCSTTKVLSETGFKCLSARNRPTAVQLQNVFNSVTTRSSSNMSKMELEHINQSLLV